MSFYTPDAAQSSNQVVRACRRNKKKLPNNQDVMKCIHKTPSCFPRVSLREHVDSARRRLLHAG